MTTPLKIRGTDGLVTSLDLLAAAYQRIAAAQSNIALTGGGGGQVGDYLTGVLVIPQSTSPGSVTLIDGGTSFNIFEGGGSSLSNLVPFIIPLGVRSLNAGWKITTGASVAVVAIGKFT